MKKVAVILSGCGYLDGAEIRESVLSHLSLEELGHEAHFFAPDRNAKDCVNHKEQTQMEEKRNILLESSRIARGKILPLDQLNPSSFDGLCLPGGFGVAKNLCSFAFDGPTGTVLPEVKNIIQDFFSQQKPIAAICISPALVAMSLPQKGIKLTLGENPEMAQALESLGAKGEICSSAQACHDLENKVFSTPAYMQDDAFLPDVFKGIKDCLSAAFPRS